MKEQLKNILDGFIRKYVQIWMSLIQYRIQIFWKTAHCICNFNTTIKCTLVIHLLASLHIGDSVVTEHMYNIYYFRLLFIQADCILRYFIVGLTRFSKIFIKSNKKRKKKQYWYNTIILFNLTNLCRNSGQIWNKCSLYVEFTNNSRQIYYLITQIL